MSRISRRTVVLLALFLACTPAFAAKRSEILWDKYGIPHIFAVNNKELFHAFGWAQAQSHGNLVLRLYGQARGRGAEYGGPAYLASDRWVLTNGIPQRAAAWHKAQKEEFRGYLDAFAEGINAYARENPGKLSAEVRAVLPVTGVDVLAHAQRVIHYTFVSSPERVAAAVARPAAAATGAAGSNTWAIAPERTKQGKAILLANPHLPWEDLYLFYEAQLNAPGVDVYGATLVGFPVVAIAFNDYLGWSHTVNTIDAADLFELIPTAAGEGYQWDDTAKPFEREDVTLRIRQADGSQRAETLKLQRSIHGPVVGTREGHPVALRVAGIDEPGMLEQWWDMGRARNVREFDAIIRRLQIPMFTIMYADRDGRIMHVFNGRVPVRPAGNHEWMGVVRGDISETLWTKTHSFDELPKAIDPPAGWLQNANDPPWTTTFPLALNVTRFPSYMAPRGMALRPQLSAKMLLENARQTFEQVIENKHSTHIELADRILSDLIGGARAKGTPRLEKAADVLEKWDRAADVSSRGAVLFEDFVRRMGRANLFAEPWSESRPRETPRGLANREPALAALEAAAEAVEKKWGRLDVPWGDVFRLRRDSLDLPGNGAPGEPFGAFRVINYTPDKDQKFKAAGGDSYVAVVEFGRTPRAMALIGYGNASQPGSPHLSDQLPFVSRKQLRPVWRTRSEIEANLDSGKDAKKVF